MPAKRVACHGMCIHMPIPSEFTWDIFVLKLRVLYASMLLQMLVPHRNGSSAPTSRLASRLLLDLKIFVVERFSYTKVDPIRYIVILPRDGSCKTRIDLMALDQRYEFRRDGLGNYNGSLIQGETTHIFPSRQRAFHP